MTKPARISYAFICLTLFLAAAMGLATPLITALFAYFALQTLSFGRSSALGLILFVIVGAAVGYGSFYFFYESLHAFPTIANNAIPEVIKIAKKYEIQLPFTDWDSLKIEALSTIKEQFGYLSKRVTIFGKHLIMVIVGLVVAVSLFITTRLELGNPHAAKDNLYSLVATEVIDRFRSFYQSFAMVMGAQILISAINTTLTAVFILWADLPYAGLILAVTFFCGLLPIIGNLISNTVIVSVGLTISPELGVAALVFLVVLHKLEYFLNSKIIGERIKNPMWLTLLALVIAERLMGIPGMILAPVILHYIRTEASKIPVLGNTSPASAPEERASPRSVTEV